MRVKIFNVIMLVLCNLLNAQKSDTILQYRAYIGWNCGYYKFDEYAESSWGVSPSLWGYCNLGEIEYKNSPLNIGVLVRLEAGVMYRYGMTIGSSLDNTEKNVQYIQDRRKYITNTFTLAYKFAGSLIVSSTTSSVALYKSFGKVVNINLGVGTTSRSISTSWINDLGSDVIIMKHDYVKPFTEESFVTRRPVKSLSSIWHAQYLDFSAKLYFPIREQAAFTVLIRMGRSIMPASATYEHSSSNETSWLSWDVTFEQAVYCLELATGFNWKLFSNVSVGYLARIKLESLNQIKVSKVSPSPPWFWQNGATQFTIDSILTPQRQPWIDVEMSRLGAIFCPELVFCLHIFFSGEFC